MSVPVQEKPRPVRPAPVARSPGWAWLSVAGPSVLAAALSLYEITGRSLGFDEGATVSIASQHGSALWSAIARDGGNMSGYYLVIHTLIGLFGNGLLVLRLPSALAVVATVGLIGMIARRLFDPLVAAVAGVLAAVSLPIVYWAQTARGYAPMVAFVCAGVLAFVALTDPREGEAPGWRPWIAYVAAMTLAMYCSFVAVLVVPAQLLVLMRRREGLRRVSSALAAVIVLSVPLAVLAVRRGSGQLFWVPRPTRMVDTQVLQSLTSAGLQPSFHHTATTYFLMWATVAAMLALVADLIRRHLRGESLWGMAMILSWCLVPAALTFLYSLVSQPIFVPRNLLISSPAVALALAPVVSDRRWPRALAAVALVAVLALRAIPVGASYAVSPEPWQTVTTDVLAQARPGDCIAFYPEDGRMAFQYYVGTGAAAIARAPRSILPIVPWGVVKPYVEDYDNLSPAQITARAAGCRRIWFVSSHEGQANGPARARANRAQYLRLDAELERSFGSGRAGPINKYGYASTIHVQLLRRRAGQGRSVKP
jgi:mannosyltransferase